jgi:hypothetical protein
MTEDTKQFIIKVLVAGVVIVALYFVFSPYQTCMRDTDGDYLSFCTQNTSW